LQRATLGHLFNEADPDRHPFPAVSILNSEGNDFFALPISVKSFGHQPPPLIRLISQHEIAVIQDDNPYVPPQQFVVYWQEVNSDERPTLTIRQFDPVTQISKRVLAPLSGLTQ